MIARLISLLAAAAVVSILAPPAALRAQEPKTTARQVPEALNFANGLLRDRRYELAAEEYLKFLKDAGPGADAADARYGLATARLFLGQSAEARRQFVAFLKEAPDHPNAPTAWFRVGETAYMVGDLPAAREALATYTKNNPGHRHLETAWPYLGDVCYRLGDLPEARRAYEQALDLFPEGRWADRARYGMARTLAAQGERDEALKRFADLAARGGREWADKARFQTGVVHAGAGQFALAVAAFEELERTSPQNPLVPEARLRRAEALGHLDRRDEAEALLRPLAAADGGLAPQAAFALGNSRWERGQMAEALGIWQDALRRFPGSAIAPALFFRTAEALAAQGRPDEARTLFLKVADAYPNDAWAADALLRAGELALKAKDGAAARALAQRLSSRFPNSPLRTDAHLIEAQAALADAKPKDAIRLLEHLLDREKPTPATARNARMSLALAYRADGQAEKAAAILDELAQSPEEEPGTADAQFLVGQGHYEAKRYAQAIPPLERYLGSKRRGSLADRALGLLAWSRLEVGQTDAAWDALEALARDYPESKVLDATRLRLGEAALAAEQYDRAAGAFRKVAESKALATLRVQALSGLGWALLKGKKPTEAATAFAALLEAFPDDALAPEASLARGRALEEAGQTDEALAAYADAGTRYPKSDRAGTAALARARLLDRADRHADAAAAYEALVRDYPKGLPGDDGLDTMLAEWGWALLDADKTVEADRVFARLLEHHPDSPRAADARVNLAESAYKAKDLDEVDRLLAPVVAPNARVDPALLQLGLFRLGRARFDRKDWAGARTLFDRLATEHASGPYRRKAMFWNAESALQAGDPQSAEAVLAALIARPRPTEDEDWLPTARLRRLQSLVLLKRWDEALADAAAIKTDLPAYVQMAEVDYARGRALQSKGKFDDAREAYQAVIAARKGDDLAARAQLMRGETYFHQEQLKEALKEFLKVAYLYNAPRHQAAALLEAGKVYEGLDQWAEAAEIYEKLRSKFPDDPRAAEAAKRLEAARQRAAGKAEQPAEPAP